MNLQGGSTTGYGEAHNRVGNVNQGQARPGQARNATSYRTILNQSNHRTLNTSNIDVADAGTRKRSSFGRRAAKDCDAFDSDVNEAPTSQTVFMANLSSADPITDEAGPSYDSDILSKVQDHDQYLDAACAHHEEYVMHDSYVKDNEVPVVHSDVSSVPNDAFLMIYNGMCEPPAQSVSNTSRNTVVKNSLTAELAIYREPVEL
nr:hypothetical protein [Tanacetum cinerariifolium]